MTSTTALGAAKLNPEHFHLINLKFIMLQVTSISLTNSETAQPAGFDSSVEPLTVNNKPHISKLKFLPDHMAQLFVETFCEAACSHTRRQKLQL